MTGTTRFGLNLGANLSDANKQLLDAVLAALELHDHEGGAQLDDPAEPPTAVLTTTGGSLPAGRTLYYRVSLVDRYGLESAATAEVSVTTPGAVATPGVPVVTVASTGGVLSVGHYYYAVAAVDAAGGETALSTAVTVAVLSATGSASVLGRPVFPTGAVAYSVYRRGPRAVGFTRIGTITDATLPFVDTGAVADDPFASATRLGLNTTNATSLVTVAPSAADLARTSVSLGPVKAWRVYRATSSGAYSASSLLTEVNGTVNPDGTGGLLTSFIDDGTSSPLPGQPLEASQTLHPSLINVGLPQARVNHRTAAYTLALADAGGVVEADSASALTITVPLSSVVAFPVGTLVQLDAVGAGTVTVAPATGVTVESLSGHLALSGQYASATLRKRDTDTWLLTGNLA